LPFKNLKTRNEYSRRYRQTHLESNRLVNRNWSVKKHQITLDEFEWLKKEQNNKCALCGKGLVFGQCGQGNYGYTVDHDHNCRNQRKHFSEKKGCVECIRGLLCHNCNTFVVPGLEFLRQRNLYVHPYLYRRPILIFRRAR
jgi:hypothetical protein